MNGIITCPTCRTEIEITSTLATQLREQWRRDVHAELREKEANIAAHEDALKDREQALERARRSVEADVVQQVELGRQQLQEEARRLAQQAQAAEVNDLNNQLHQAKHDLSLAQQAELAVRKERRSLEDEKQALQLTVARTVDEERVKIRDEAKRQADEEHRLKIAENDMRVAELRRQIDELKRKAEQGSHRIQGEVLELELEDLLRNHFPGDVIEPVPVSKNGGDVLHHVVDAAGRHCGTILWEAKQTKSFNEAWLPKLRDDLRAARGQSAVLVSTELPKGVTTFTQMDGVWVTSRACVVGVAAALRQGMMELARLRSTLEGKQTQVGQLYDYLVSPQFCQLVQGVVEPYRAMKEDLDSERRSMQRIWNKREKQLDRALKHASALHGDISGILGNTLPMIPLLELAAIAPEAEEETIQALIAAGSDSPF